MKTFVISVCIFLLIIGLPIHNTFAGTGPTLTYEPTTFNEAASNDGAIDNTTPMTITVALDEFTGNNGDNFVAIGNIVVTNLPSGLTVVATRTSSTELSVTITGAADVHTSSDNVSDLTFTFQDAAFTGGDASVVAGYNTNDLQITFLDPPPTPTATAPSSGNGSSGSPYQIANLENLYWITASDEVVSDPSQSARWAAHYIQTSNIDATSTDGGENWGSEGWPPIGSSTTKFTGSYNGDGYTINGLYIYRSSDTYVGLFGWANNATIGNVGLTNVNITGGSYTGGLVGYGSGSSVYSCYSTGSVYGTGNVGGLIGSTASQVASCYSSCAVNGASGCNNLGGLMGYGANKVSNCYARGSVSGNGNGSSEFSGLIGLPGSGTISDCFSTGSVSGTNAYLNGCVGSLYGASVTNTFWDTETSGRSSSAGGTGKTTAEMKTESTFTNAGWNFNYFWNIDGSTNNGYPFLSTDVFENLTATAPSGNGEAGTPYQIATLNNLYWLSQNSTQWSKLFVQTANINAISTFILDGGNGFTPIGNSGTKFTGTYDGGEYTIESLFIDQSSNNYVGLFGWANGATIGNIGVTNVDITGGSYTGGLVGYGASSTISGCYSTGTVYGSGNVGGLIGAYASSVTRCFSNCDVEGASGCNHIGGLIGAYPTTVSNCYATGSVNGDGTEYSSEFAGLIGLPGSGTTSNCYSTGSVSGTNAYLHGCVGSLYGATVTNSFWDTETSGRSSSSGGTGKTTSQMKTLSTFTDAGWDFEAETTNGTDDYWDMDVTQAINNGYPYLSWEDGEDVSLPVELTAFSAEWRSGGVLLYWTTESENENLGFILERRNLKLETGNWEEVASYLTDSELEGHGSTTEKHDYQFGDTKVQSGMTYEYRLGDVDFSGKVTWHRTVEITVESGDIQMATTFGLHKAYPNPFNPSVTLNYTLNEGNSTTLDIYNLRGQLVETLVKTDQARGNYTITWQPENLGAGVYIVRLQSGNKTNIQKIVFMK